jgi:hypothetical protein
MMEGTSNDSYEVLHCNNFASISRFPTFWLGGDTELVLNGGLGGRFSARNQPIAYVSFEFRFITKSNQREYIFRFNIATECCITYTFGVGHDVRATS